MLLFRVNYTLYDATVPELKEIVVLTHSLQDVCSSLAFKAAAAADPTTGLRGQAPSRLQSELLRMSCDKANS
jgi:hypothetical protein